MSQALEPEQSTIQQDALHEKLLQIRCEDELPGLQGRFVDLVAGIITPGAALPAHVEIVPQKPDRSHLLTVAPYLHLKHEGH